MGRMIDADAIIQAVCTKLGIKDKKFLLQSEKAIVDVILNAPTVDAVSVVRCKECKHGKYEFTDNKDWIYCKHHYDYWTADDFCSYGERKETDHE